MSLLKGKKMEKTLTIGGEIAVTTDENSRVTNIQFMPENEYAFVLERGSCTHGQLQMLRNAYFDFVASKPRKKANSELIAKAAHGRLSATRDQGYQVTLKSFSSESIDWQKAFVTETIDLLTDLMGPERIRGILKDIVFKL